jgi:hypothetical protein
VTLHVLTEERYDRPWAREQSEAFHFLGRVLCYEDGDLDQIAVEGDDVSSVGILELNRVAWHPNGSERCLENFDDNFGLSWSDSEFVGEVVEVLAHDIERPGRFGLAGTRAAFAGAPDMASAQSEFLG